MAEAGGPRSMHGMTLQRPCRCHQLPRGSCIILAEGASLQGAGMHVRCALTDLLDLDIVLGLVDALSVWRVGRRVSSCQYYMHDAGRGSFPARGRHAREVSSCLLRHLFVTTNMDYLKSPFAIVLNDTHPVFSLCSTLTVEAVLLRDA